MYTLPVSWDTGVPVIGAAQLAIPTASFQASGTFFSLAPGVSAPYMSVVEDFTYNPSGTAIAFTPQSNIPGNPLASGLYTLTSAGVQSRLLTFFPTLFSWGYTDRISYDDSSSNAVKTMKSDGTNQITVITGNRTTAVGSPTYSPLADYIVFNSNDSSRGGYHGLKTVPSPGGTAFNLVTQGGWVTNWR
jgi:Tol biopolymer transport system component